MEYTLSLVLDVFLGILLVLASVIWLFLAVTNFRRYLIEGIHLQCADAEERWGDGIEMWLVIFFHSLAEIVIFPLLVTLRTVQLVIDLPSVVGQVRREMKKV